MAGLPVPAGPAGVFALLAGWCGRVASTLRSMTGDALFGPDGTQLPAPLPALSDPLVTPGTAAASSRNGQAPAGTPFDAAGLDVNAVPLPASLDPSAIRDAIRAALGDEPTPDQSPAEPAPPPSPAPASAPPPESLLTPPSGIPVQLGRPPPPGPVQPSQAQPGRPSGTPVQLGHPPASPPSGLPARPGQPPGAPAARWPTDRPPRAPLDQARRSPSGGGWIGCIVLLIFIVIVTFNIVSAIVDAITGG